MDVITVILEPHDEVLAFTPTYKAGIMVDDRFEKTIKGCPQGSPLSPMLSNIVLNELDHELERRGHRYCRWADDFLVMVKSERAARRVIGGLIPYLEG